MDLRKVLFKIISFKLLLFLTIKTKNPFHFNVKRKLLLKFLIFITLQS